jgi:predicted aldo/keto reductase-like oxidoreductase
MVQSGLFETMQFPMSVIASEDEIKLVELCKDYDVGFIAMKAMAGGLISDAKAAFVFLRQFDNVVPIWGIQYMWELDEFLKYEHNPPELDNDIWDIIYKDREELSIDFCRACGYCMPCPVDINIPMAARTQLLIGRMDLKGLVNDEYQTMMQRINDCTGCNFCIGHCPYKLNTPALLRKNLEFYNEFLEKYNR